MNPNDIELKFQEVSDPEEVNIFKSIEAKIGTILENISKPIKFPDIFNIRGEVDVKTLPPVTFDRTQTFKISEIPSVKINNLSELSTKFDTLFVGLQLALQKTVGGLKLVIPDTVKVSNQIVVKDWQDLLDGVEELKKGFNILINQEKTGKGNGGNPMEVAITNFPPAMVPTPVTHVSVNALQGTVKTTAATVGTSLTKLPTYGQLFNRRAVQIYNNSTNIIYVGGSDVTTANGMPIPASSYSQAFDLGYNVILYGIAASGSNNVRVIEVSDDASGR